MKTERLTILLDKHERAIVNALAEHERLSLSTMTRRLLLDEAERRRIRVDVEREVEREPAPA